MQGARMVRPHSRLPYALGRLRGSETGLALTGGAGVLCCQSGGDLHDDLHRFLIQESHHVIPLALDC